MKKKNFTPSQINDVAIGSYDVAKEQFINFRFKKIILWNDFFYTIDTLILIGVTNFNEQNIKT